MRSSALPPGAPGSARPRSARLPRTDWAVPGSVIRNLDTAPGSPYRPGEKVVALTFDDGPSAVYTPQILRILVAARASASFEIIGVHGGAYPRILRAENATGMALVNHTWTHIGLAPLAAWRWPAEVDRTSKLLRDVTGHPVRCLRPPYGRSDRAVDTQLRRRGLAELAWDVDPSDYLRPGAAVITLRVLSALHPGAIVIMHDGGGNRAQTVAALPAIIGGIRADGYQIVPVCAADTNRQRSGAPVKAPAADPRAIRGVSATRLARVRYPPRLAAPGRSGPPMPAPDTTITSCSPRRNALRGAPSGPPHPSRRAGTAGAMSRPVAARSRCPARTRNNRRNGVAADSGAGGRGRAGAGARAEAESRGDQLGKPSPSGFSVRADLGFRW